VIPNNWKQYQFQILVRNQPLEIRVTKQECEITNKGNQSIDIIVFEQNIHIESGKTYFVQTT
jgi:trehalose/maltose hydrolase-like predicted phosphorylase